MKMKSIVLTAALATAFSAFSDTDTVNVDWFADSPDSVHYFDRNINDPVVVTNSVAASAGFTVAAYAVTAYVTNLVVFAETPAQEDLKSSTKGAICATASNWYGLSKADGGEKTWTPLTSLGTPAENTSYALKMEFKEDGGVAKVKYSVGGGSSDWLKSPGTYGQPDFYAFAGMGGCTNIVGEIVVAVTETSVDGGTILVPTDGDAYAAARENPNDTAVANGLKNWVNYVLGIDAPTATSKPYAAPEQNSDTDKLTFRLGGVGTIRGQDISGATVTYTVDESTSKDFTSGVTLGKDYVDPEDSVKVTLPSSGVKYYRIKIRIEPKTTP